MKNIYLVAFSILSQSLTFPANSAHAVDRYWVGLTPPQVPASLRDFSHQVERRSNVERDAKNTSIAVTVVVLVGAAATAIVATQSKSLALHERTALSHETRAKYSEFDPDIRMSLDYINAMIRVGQQGEVPQGFTAGQKWTHNAMVHLNNAYNMGQPVGDRLGYADIKSPINNGLTGVATGLTAAALVAPFIPIWHSGIKSWYRAANHIDEPAFQQAFKDITISADESCKAFSPNYSAAMDKKTMLLRSMKFKREDIDSGKVELIHQGQKITGDEFDRLDVNGGVFYPFASLKCRTGPFSKRVPIQDLVAVEAAK